LHALDSVVRIVRTSEVHETAAVDAPPGSPQFLNMVILGHTSLAPLALLDALQAIEHHLGRPPRRVRNEPRLIDLDLIAYGATRLRTSRLTLPHPRAQGRSFVVEPLRELGAAGGRIADWLG
jgi:2-amino-4-hydroxy-6-hydroxymethyldihydropteridine diphosphokinase